MKPEEIAECLLDAKAITFCPDKPYTFASGLVSPVYCNNREFYKHPVHRSLVANALAQRVKMMETMPDVIAGTATAGIPWASFVADRLGMPMVTVRSTPKTHGIDERIEPRLEPHSHAVVLDDMFSTGGSVLRAVNILREEGQARVDSICSITTYELAELAENTKRESVIPLSLVAVRQVLERAIALKYIDESDAREIQRFQADPKSWKPPNAKNKAL